MKRRGTATKQAVETARTLRQKETPAERALWQVLRDRQVAGAEFRRQHPFDRFILDFLCVEHQLAVEIDGGVHDERERRNYDAARTAFLQERGIKVVRFTSDQVCNDLGGVIKSILDALA